MYDKKQLSTKYDYKIWFSTPVAPNFSTTLTSETITLGEYKNWIWPTIDPGTFAFRDVQVDLLTLASYFKTIDASNVFSDDPRGISCKANSGCD